MVVDPERQRQAEAPLFYADGTPVASHHPEPQPFPHPHPEPHHPPHIEVIDTGFDTRFLHAVSIICCLLSLVLSPFVEIIPVIMYTAYGPQLFKSSSFDSARILLADLIITWLVFVVWIVLTTVMAVFTFGFFAPFYVFLSFYIIVIVHLTRARRATTSQIYIVEPQHFVHM